MNRWMGAVAIGVALASMGVGPVASGDICNAWPTCRGGDSRPVFPFSQPAETQPDLPPLRISNGGFAEKGPGAIFEGATCFFEVKRGKPRDLVSTVRYSSKSGTATKGVDFEDVDEKATFQKTEDLWILSVDTFQDADPEGTERFSVELRNPTNAKIVDKVGFCEVFDAG